MAWILVAGLLVVATGMAMTLVRQRLALTATREALDARVASLEASLASAAAEASALAESAAVAEAAAASAEAAEAAEAAQAAAATEAVAEAEVAPPFDARLAALWSLAQIEQQRTWRLSMASGVEGDPGLAGALAMEVDRIREDVGTPGSLETHLDSAVGVQDAALALLAARELLATLVPHTQAYDMVVQQHSAELAIDVVCTGWEGPTEAADDISRLLAAVAPAGGNLSLDTDPDGRLRASLQLPLLG
jgi:hypothetical protein